jgi:DnaJ-class molecular chaperone
MYSEYVGKTNPWDVPGWERTTKKADERIFTKTPETTRTAYQILGVDGGAVESEIKAAFRKLAMLHHPDRGGSNLEFCKIHAAWTWLRAYHRFK